MMARVYLVGVSKSLVRPIALEKAQGTRAATPRPRPGSLTRDLADISAEARRRYQETQRAIKRCRPDGPSL